MQPHLHDNSLKYEVDESKTQFFKKEYISVPMFEGKTSVEELLQPYCAIGSGTQGHTTSKVNTCCDRCTLM